MNKILIVIALMVALSGCWRNTPERQVEDYKICIEGGMTPVVTSIGEVSCRP